MAVCCIAGQYRRRELMATRFHPLNVNREGTGCNRGTHSNKRVAQKDMDLYRENLNNRWGAGTTEFLFKLSQKDRALGNERIGSARERCADGIPDLHAAR